MSATAKTSNISSDTESSAGLPVKKQSQKQLPVPKIALVCDWLTNVGGAERVLLSLHQMYPDAPIYTSQYDQKGIDWFKDADVRTGWLQILPARLRRFLAPLRQYYFSHLDLSNYDLVISVTGAEAKSIITKKQGKTEHIHSGSEHSDLKPEHQNQKTEQPEHSTIHLCYCHVPTQYYWQMYDDYVKNPGFGILNPLMRLGLKTLITPLRKADFEAAKRPDRFISISDYAASQIKKYYKREAVIVHPPVAVEKFTQPVENFETKIGKSQVKNHSTHKIKPTKSQKNTTKSQSAAIQISQLSAQKSHQAAITGQNYNTRHGFITSSRQVTWKRLDLCIKACLKTGQPLTIIGDGPEHQNLVKLAKNSPLITFLPQMTQDELKNHLCSAKAYLFPSLEPFGIAPVEALAAGCPVIAYGAGGALDYITPGINGLLFPSQTVSSLAKAINNFLSLEETFSPAIISASAAPFRESVFQEKISQIVQSSLKNNIKSSKNKVQNA